MRNAIALFTWLLAILLAIVLTWLIAVRIYHTVFTPLPYRDPEPPTTTSEEPV